MKKINEASTLSALGATKQDVAKIHQGNINIPHDMEYEPVKTKGEAKAYLQQGHLVLGKSADGSFASIIMQNRDLRYSSGRTETNYRVTFDGESHQTPSLKDALSRLPGRGWTFYRSVKDLDTRFGGNVDDSEWDDEIDHMDKEVEKIERIYGKQLKTEARKYAQEVRRAISSVVTQDKRTSSYRFSDNTAAKSLERLKAAYDKLTAIAKSKTPFSTLASASTKPWATGGRGFPSLVGREVATNFSDFGSFYHIPGQAGRWAKQTPASTAKIVRFALSELRKIRDDAFRSYHKPKDPIEAEPYSLRVKEAYDRFVESGEVNSITRKQK